MQNATEREETIEYDCDLIVNTFVRLGYGVGNDLDLTEACSTIDNFNLNFNLITCSI